MQAKIYVMYKPETGEIIGWVSDHAEPKDPGLVLSPTGAPVDGATFYVKNGVVTARPQNPARLDDGKQLYRLPIPCTITINDKSYPCREDRATLEFTYPGRYAIRVRSFPWQDATFEITK
ncbi:MAG: hypothetical protein WKF61_01040 [Luteimonas sp.]